METKLIIQITVGDNNALMVSTKTVDDVTVTIGIVVQYRVIEEMAYAPKMTLDKVFSEKDDISEAVLSHLKTAFIPGSVNY